MATGDQTDISARLAKLLPPWFGDANPVISALIAGASTALAFVYGLYAYAVAQCRIMTATGIWLDLIAQDFFGATLQRGANQSDASFRASVISALFRPRATRTAISNMLVALTGNTPEIIEPTTGADCGAYSVGYCGYGAAGSYGSILLPAKAFVVAYRPPQPGIASVAGYGISSGGYGVASEAEYASLSLIAGILSDADIYAAIAATSAAGVEIWARVRNLPTPLPITIDGRAFTLDGRVLTIN